MPAAQRPRLCNRATLTESLEDEARDLGGTSGLPEFADLLDGLFGWRSITDRN